MDGIPVAIEEDNSRAIRLRALVRLSWVIPLYGLGFLLFKLLSTWFTGPGVLLVPAILAVPLVIALTELASGISFGQLSQRWDALAGWQRGVLGTVVVLFALVFVLAAPIMVGVMLHIF